MLSTRFSSFLALLVCLAACSSSGGSEFWSCAHDTDCSSSTGFCDPGQATCQPPQGGFTMSSFQSTGTGVEFTWALDASLPVTGLRVLLDGTPAGDAQRLLSSDWGLIWVLDLDVSGLPDGTHYVRAVAQAGDRTLYSGETTWTVSNPPNLISQSPTNDADDVPVASPVVLTFDEPVSLQHGGSIQFESAGATIPAVVSWSDGGRTLTAVCQHPERLGHIVNLMYSVSDQEGSFATGAVWYGLEAPQVVLTGPYAPVTTSGTQAFYATVSGSPEKVEVLADDGVHLEGVVLGTMSVSGSMGSFYWDTTTVGPGTYPIWLRAVRGDWAVTSAAVDVTVTK